MVKEEKQVNPIHEGLMKRRTVTLSGEINHESMTDAGQRLIQLQMQSNDRINLIIDSGGGGAGAALQLCDVINTVITAPVRGIAFGTCGSAATFIMLHCHERIATPYSRFLVHSGTRSRISIPINQTTSENLEQLLHEVKSVEEMVIKLYMEKLRPDHWTGKETNKVKREFVEKLISRGDQRFDEWMSAEEAVKIGLIERVVRDKLDIF